MFNQIYKNRRVLVTGHTGFKGSWLCRWLSVLGAEICGVSLPMDTEQAHVDLLNTAMRSELCDIRDKDGIRKIFEDFKPEIVFHLAAQPIVRRSYVEPAATFETNVMGTINVLEACRNIDTIAAIVVITSDKCYENREQLWGYREHDAMGGYDPYSASKGCTELVVSSYRRSFFNVNDFGKKHNVLLASVRAGNVIGGGDWASDRLVPDIMRATAVGKTTIIRSPYSVRPWQHVLEPLSGYLLLGARLFAGDAAVADGWNFGPADNAIITVEQAAQQLALYWNDISLSIMPPPEQPHEAGLLRLDCSKAKYELGWSGVLTPEETFEMTAVWYKEFYRNGMVITDSQLCDYVDKARCREAVWIS